MTGRLSAIVLLALAGWLALPGTALAAITCRIDSATSLDFGTLNFPIGQATTTSTVTVSCRGTTNADVGKSALVCVSVAASNPHQMARTTAPAAALAYGMYRDAAHAQGLNYTINASTMVAIATRNAWYSQPVTLYGQLDASQPNPTAGDYIDPVTGIWGWATAPANCDNVQQASPDFAFQARARLAASCLIQANDLDFGQQPGLPAAVVATTSIVVTCTNGTSYKVSLDGGGNNSIADRRMRLNGVGPQTVAYNLYADSARTQLWGNAVTGSVVTGVGAGNGIGTPQTIPVYGLVPADAAVVTGAYSDLVTATVEY